MWQKMGFETEDWATTLPRVPRHLDLPDERLDDGLIIVVGFALTDSAALGSNHGYNFLLKIADVAESIDSKNTA